MKKNILIIAIVCMIISSISAFSQSDKTYIIVEKTLSTLLDIEAVRDIASQREVIINQLKEIDQLVAIGKVNLKQYKQLQSAYTEMSQNFNLFSEQLNDDLNSYNKFSDVMNLDKLQEAFNSDYNAKLNAAKNIYDNRFAPVYSDVLLNSNRQTKGLFALAIPYIIKIAPTVISIVSDLINSKENKEGSIFNLIKPLLHEKINNLIGFPQWDEYVKHTPNNVISTENNTKPATGNILVNSSVINYSLINAQILFIDNKGKPITFNKPKNIVEDFNNDFTNAQAPIFFSENSFTEGSSFNLKISGYTYYAVLSFNYITHNWDLLESVSNRNVREGYDEPSVNETVLLPPTPEEEIAKGRKKRFIISGGEPTEHFLVLLSNKKIGIDRLSNLEKSTAINNDKFDEINFVFGKSIVKIPTLVVENDKNQLEDIILKNIASDGQIIVPLYFRLMKK